LLYSYSSEDHMNTCQNCGKLNTPETNFCRFCGTKFLIQQVPVVDNPYDYSAPRPYAWKTDEFQTQNEARKTISDQAPPNNRPFNPANPQQFAAMPLAYQQPNNQHAQLAHRPGYAMDGNYRCPKCGTSYLPVLERRVSTAGWIVFSALLVFTVIFFWIGLLMKEDVAVCPVCRWKSSGS